jgi:lipid A 4'-phosphatase
MPRIDGRAAHWALLAALLLCAAVFLLFPQLDLAASALFYRPERGFVLLAYPAWQDFKDVVNDVPKVIVIGCAAFLVLSHALRRWQSLRYGALFTALLLALGAGAAVNAVKDLWGRARPIQIQQFGGTQQFTPALVPAHQCERNCAFTSGHAAIGFALMAPAFFDRRRRRAWFAAGIAGGVLLGVMRMAQGGHFLSDVVFSGWIVFGVGLALDWALRRMGYGQPPAPKPAG